MKFSRILLIRYFKFEKVWHFKVTCIDKKLLPWKVEFMFLHNFE